MAERARSFEDYYAILGVKSTATLEEIKARYRELVREGHSDRHPEASADEKRLLDERIAVIIRAFKTLREPESRRKFDETRERIRKEVEELDAVGGQSTEEEVSDYALLKSTIGSRDYVGVRPARNAGVIEVQGSQFILSYVDSQGCMHRHAATFQRESLLEQLGASKEYFEECVFEETKGAASGGTTSTTRGYTFVSTLLLSKRLRWSCSAATWQALNAPKKSTTPVTQIFDRSMDRASGNWREENLQPSEASLRQAVAADLRQGGILSRALPGYEERPAQVKMAAAVAHVLESGEHLIVEAGTGTGKSLAYLLPIIRSGKVALVSTANKALQEQLFYKDIPFVQRNVQPFKAALVKGMGNYLCLDRLPEEQSFQQLVKHRSFASMERLMSDPDVWDGDFDLLTESLPPDVRGRLAADSDQCAWRACNWFADCYVRRMRERSRDAQVIVVNHTLLLLDAAMGGFLLPERDVIVIDEAHHLEEEATRAFTVTVTPGRVASLLTLRRLRDHADQRTQQEAADADVHLWAALQQRIPFDARGRQNLVEPLEEGLRLASAIDMLANSLATNRPPNQDDKEEQLYEKLVKRTRALASDLRVVFGRQSPEERVYYVEQIGGSGRRAPQLSVSAAPLYVTELLREKLFDKIPTIATSATLAVGGDFSFYRNRVGLENAKQLVLPLTFNYRENALLYVPRMKREPAYGAASGPYLDELAEQMRDLVEASEGRAFLLFSSNNALRGVHERIADVLKAQDFNLIVQGREMGRVEMLRQFRELPQAVLFGLKSFWEGVDVAGEALSLVVIDKLPFDPPDDPVQEARVAKMKEAGANWFGEYVLPQAILRLKQGIGRLLRTADDRGVMAILDTRLHTKYYGRQVLNALPPARRTIAIEDVRRFFQDV